jgi:hypothetical protein
MSLAANPGMMRRERERLGLSVSRAAWLIGVKPVEYSVSRQASPIRAGRRGTRCASCWPQTFADRA